MLRKEMTFEPTTRAVSSARLFAMEVVSAERPDSAIVALLVSELAANAVRHARTGFRLSVAMWADRTRVELSDGSGVPPKFPQGPGDGEPCGRGLTLVAALADSFGCTPTFTGKTVWFETRFPPAR